MTIGEFYANDLGTGNLELLARFFDKYPEYADKTFLSVKVSLQYNTFVLDTERCFHIILVIYRAELYQGNSLLTHR